ncbi:MAG: 4-hydroxythreonine-4-phosphate dehydrogenase PdxA, partial [Ignavibacteriaceae bacterium]
MNKFIFTCGDTNGIGPEIVIKALNKISAGTEDDYIFICPKNIFLETAKFASVYFDFKIKNSLGEPEPGIVTVLNIKNTIPEWGKPTKASGKAAFKAIKTSSDLLVKGKADAVITAPISKRAIKLAGHDYPGHTEMYAGWTKTKNFVMAFFSKEINAALVTIHEPLKNVPKLLSAKNISSKIDVVVNMLRRDMNIEKPEIAVLGLNPHAGEEGLIGTEEKKTITPVIKESEYSEYLSGPFSPDAFFGRRLYEDFDLVLGMYHDQVLIPFKLLSFSSGVNYTAGLP